ncbi:MAG: hypothetical protein ACI4DS_07900 [Eubacterium sp.]
MSDRKEIIISARKYISNLKKFRLIFLVMLLIGSGLIVYNTKKTSITVSTNDNGYYGAQSYIKISTSSDTMKNVCLYATAEESMNSLNDEIQRQGYPIISDDDYITVSVYSNNYIIVSVYGRGDSQRIKEISQQLAQHTVQLAKSKFNVATVEIDGETTLFNAIKNNATSYVRNYGPIVHSNSGSILKSVIQLSNIIIIIACILLGFVIVLVISMFDQKVYVKEDISQVDKLDYLADICNLKDFSLYENSIAEYIKSLNKKNISFVISQEIRNNSKAMKLKEGVSSLVTDVNVELKEGLITNAQTINEVKKSDAVILLIIAGHDNEKTIRMALDGLRLSNINIIGYVIA